MNSGGLFVFFKESRFAFKEKSRERIPPEVVCNILKERENLKVLIWGSV